MKNKLGFKIYLTQKCFREKQGCGELFEKLEDDMANLLAKYGLEGAIGNNITGNTIVFPVSGQDIVVESSHGDFYVDARTGEVVSREICCDKQPTPVSCNNDYAQIYKFDLEEWKAYYGKDEVDAAIDILDLGYWLSNCVYIPAEKDHRKKSRNITDLNAG